MPAVTSLELLALRDRVAALNLAERAGRLGAVCVANRLEIPFFDQRYRLDKTGVTDWQGKSAAELVAYVLYHYALRAPCSAPAAGPKVSFRELRDAGPLAVHFATNTHKTIAQSFAERPEALRAAAARLGGQPIPGNHAYDVWMRLNALPRVAIDLQVNARDEEFPAQCSLAFDPSVEAYLDSRSIFILGTYLTGRLIALRAPGEPAADQARQPQELDR